MNRLQFSDDLSRLLGAGPSAIEHDDVAELAAIGATAGELERKLVIGLNLQQVIAWNRRAPDVRLARLTVNPSCFAGVQVGDQFRHEVLRFTQDDVPRQVQVLRGGRGMGPPHHRAHAVVTTPAKNFPKRRGLHRHTGKHDHISPLQVAIGQALDVQVHQPARPVARQHRRHRDETQWRQQAPAPGEGQGARTTPVRFRCLRVDQQDAHARCHPFRFTVCSAQAP